MLKIAHRINTLSALSKTPIEYGIELDLRWEGKSIILNHEPFLKGELFEDLLKEYKHQLIILNVKEEGIEEEIIRLLQKYKISNYFFLDLSLPYLIKYLQKGEKNIAVRFSEYEPLDFAMAFKGKLNWVWVDCFSSMPLNAETYLLLKKNFKICLVSPELQGHELHRIEEFKKQLTGMDIDAVCTKRPDLW